MAKQINVSSVGFGFAQHFYAVWYAISPSIGSCTIVPMVNPQSWAACVSCLRKTCATEPTKLALVPPYWLTLRMKKARNDVTSRLSMYLMLASS